MHKFLFTLLLSALLQSGGQPIPVPVPNPNFYAGYGSSIVQDLGVTPSQLQEYQAGYVHEGIYTLTLPPANNFPAYPGYYKMKISFGTQDLCEGSGWGTRAQSQVVIVCPSPGYLIVDHSLDCDQNPCIVGVAQGRSNLVLSVTVNGWTVQFKDVSLNFTPTN